MKEIAKFKVFIAVSVLLFLVFPIVNMILTFSKTWMGRLQCLGMNFPEIYCIPDTFAFHENNCNKQKPKDLDKCAEAQVKYVKCQEKSDAIHKADEKIKQNCFA